MIYLRVNSLSRMSTSIMTEESTFSWINRHHIVKPSQNIREELCKSDRYFNSNMYKTAASNIASLSTLAVADHKIYVGNFGCIFSISPKNPVYAPKESGDDIWKFIWTIRSRTLNLHKCTLLHANLMWRIGWLWY